MAPPDVPFARPLYPPSHDKGPVKDDVDVIGVKRAVSRAGFWPWQPFDDTYSEDFAMHGVKPFQQASGLTATGNYGETTHNKLCETRRKDMATEWAFDTIAIRSMEQADERINKSPDDLIKEKVRLMIAFGMLFDGPYVFGGEHDGSFADDDVHDGFDCSSSCSFMLHRFDLFPQSSRAQTSGWFESFALPGRGKYLTIHANGEHVWMEFNIDGVYKRFDTSPHRDGAHGPRIRSTRRFDSGFAHRHPAGF